MSKLIEVREKLATKRRELHELFETYPDLDMPDDVAASIKGRNDELTDLGKEHDRLSELDAIATKNRGEHDRLSRPAGGMTHPDNGATGEGAQVGARRAAPLRLGDLFIKTEAFTGYSRVHRRGPVTEIDADQFEKSYGAEFKALLDTTGWPVEDRRTGFIQPGALRRVTVTDLVPMGTTTAGSIVYLEETTTTNAAAAVAQGAAKPESTLVFTEKTVPVRKIATVLPVTDELMADEPTMRSYVDARLRLFLDLEEERQIVNGSGVAPNMTGLYNVTGIQTQAKGTDPTPDAVYKAIVKVQTGAFLQPNAVIVHPNDWQDIRLLRTTDGMYIWGSPAEAGPERIWGLPVASTTAATENTGLVAALDGGVQYFRREGVSFAVSDQHSDFFVTNKLMLRVEMRGALVVYRPSSICSVTGI